MAKTQARLFFRGWTAPAVLWRAIPLAVLAVLLLVPAKQTRAADIFVGDAAGLQTAVASATASDVIILTTNISFDGTATTYTASGTNVFPSVDAGRTVIIDGNGFSITRTGGSFRFFNVESGSTLTLIDVTLVAGTANGAGSPTNQGGAIYNAGTLNLQNAKFSGNNATAGGGAVYSLGTVNAELAQFNNNTITGTGGIYDGGGAVFNFGGTLNITSSTFTGNRMTNVNNGGGAAIANMSRSGNNGSMTVTGSTFSSNVSGYSGGAIFHVAGPDGGATSGTITDSTFSSNTAVAGGAIYTTEDNTSILIERSVFTGNTATGVPASGSATDRGGGAIYSRAENATISNSRIEGNNSPRGGGIYVWEWRTSHSATMDINQTLIASNTADQGGGIYSRNKGRPTLNNVTLSGNSGSTAGGAILNREASQTTLNNVTITGNTSSNGSGIWNTESGSTVRINDSILTAASGTVCGVQSGASYVNDGGSLDTDGSCGVGTTGDPQLSALADNGGFSRTHALSLTSPALGIGAGCVTTDQRGVTRGASCDAGAYQDNGSTPAQVSYSLTTNPITEGSPSQVSITVNNTTGTQPVRVNVFFKLGGTASRTADYTEAGLIGGATFNVAAGASNNQTININALTDAIDESNETLALTMSFTGYATLSGSAAQTLTIIDTTSLPAAEVNVSPTTLNIDEGDSAQYVVSVNRPPNVGETVTVTVDTPLPAGLNVSPGSVTFTNADFNSKTITVTPDDDTVDTGDRNGLTLAHTVATSGGAFTGVTTSNVTVNITEDDVPSVTIDPQAVSLLEGNPATAAYDISIGSRPAVGETVTITLADASGELTFPATVTFDNTSASLTQTVNIGITDNSIADGTRILPITHTVSSSLGGSGYNSLGALPDVDATITDDDIADVTITPVNNSVVEGGSITYTIALATQPRAGETITVTLTPDDAGVTAPVSVTFTGLTTSQPVVASIPDNDLPDGARTVTISHLVSSDQPTSPYNAVAGIPDEVIAVGDDETGNGPQTPGISAFDPAISKLGFLVPGQVGVTGERLEWVVTVSNTSSITGENVVITDTLIPELRLVRVEAAAGTVTTSGQTVTVTFATLAPGETVQFTIVTDVIRGGEINNEACLTADNFDGGERCTSALTVASLPDTGETPWWAPWILAAFVSLAGIVFSGAGLMWRARR